MSARSRFTSVHPESGHVFFMIIVLGTSILTLLLLAGFAREYMRLRAMPNLSPPTSPGRDQPFVSLLVPARNEDRNIGRFLEGALQQKYHSYEVVVVDDHSTDATPEIIASYAARYRQLRSIQSAPLPAGWTGKCYACHQAASVARGEWLLFLDADTIPQPSLVAALVTHMQQHHLDMLTIFPLIELGSFWERIILPSFFTLLHSVFPFRRLNAPDVQPEETMANGQCIVVRRHAYEAAGGHHAIRNEVLDDVMLARMLRKAGFRTGAALGLRELRVRMYTNRKEVVEGLSKNAVSGFRSGGSRSLWGGIEQFALALLPLCLFVLGLMLLIIRGDILSWAVIMHAIVVGGIAFGFWSFLLQKRYHLSPLYALLWPFGMICYGLIALLSWRNLLSGRGVMWKGRTYART